MSDPVAEPTPVEEGKVEKEAPKVEEPAAEEGACPIACSRGDGPFGLKCPCKHPEIFEEFFAKYPVAFRRIQEVLFLKRPVVLGVVFVLVNLLFYIWKKMDLNFYAAAALLALLCTIYHAFVAKFVPKIFDIAFKTNVEQGTPEEATHIRNEKEAAQFFAKYLKFMPVVLGLIEKLYKDQTLVGRLIWCGALAGLFIFFLVIDLFCVFWFLVDLVLIVPPVLTHEKVQALLNKK